MEFSPSLRSNDDFKGNAAIYLFSSPSNAIISSFGLYEDVFCNVLETESWFMFDVVPHVNSVPHHK